MNEDNIKIKILGATITIAVGIVLYSVIGVYVNVSSVSIHDEFPDHFRIYTPVPEQTLTVRVYNNAPMTLPYMNPFYGLSVTIEAENNAFAYFRGLGNKKHNFTDTSLSLGRIDSGKNEDADIVLHLDEGDLRMTISVHFRFGISIPCTSRTYFIEYQDEVYVIQES